MAQSSNRVPTPTEVLIERCYKLPEKIELAMEKYRRLEELFREERNLTGICNRREFSDKVVIFNDIRRRAFLALETIRSGKFRESIANRNRALTISVRKANAAKKAALAENGNGETPALPSTPSPDTSDNRRGSIPESTKSTGAESENSVAGLSTQMKHISQGQDWQHYGSLDRARGRRSALKNARSHSTFIPVEPHVGAYLIKPDQHYRENLGVLPPPHEPLTPFPLSVTSSNGRKLRSETRVSVSPNNYSPDIPPALPPKSTKDSFVRYPKHISELSGEGPPFAGLLTWGDFQTPEFNGNGILGALIGTIGRVQNINHLINGMPERGQSSGVLLTSEIGRDKELKGWSETYLDDESLSSKSSGEGSAKISSTSNGRTTEDSLIVKPFEMSDYYKYSVNYKKDMNPNTPVAAKPLTSNERISPQNLNNGNIRPPVLPPKQRSNAYLGYATTGPEEDEKPFVSTNPTLV